MPKLLRAPTVALAACILAICAADALAQPARTSTEGPVHYAPEPAQATARPAPGPKDTAFDSAGEIADTGATGEGFVAGEPTLDESDPPPIRRHPHFKSDIWLPLPSIILPGFGQYFQGDWTGGVYTAVSVVGTIVALQGLLEAAAESGEDVDGNPAAQLTSENWTIRRAMLGSLASQGSGLLSAYSAFRISVPRFQQEDGKYLFLTEKESVGDLMAAPLRFGHLLKPTTLIPLGVLTGGVIWLVDYERAHHRGADWTASPDDVPFYGALAYNAGTSEEALFRGWLLPVAHQYMGRHFWLANSAQALLFGAAHYSEANPLPWPQTLIGLYFGWLTRRNQWTLSEAIFVHAWWDMILFAGQIAANREEDLGAARVRFDLPLGW